MTEKIKFIACMTKYVYKNVEYFAVSSTNFQRKFPLTARFV